MAAWQVVVLVVVLVDSSSASPYPWAHQERDRGRHGRLLAECGVLTCYARLAATGASPSM